MRVWRRMRELGWDESLGLGFGEYQCHEVFLFDRGIALVGDDYDVVVFSYN